MDVEQPANAAHIVDIQSSESEQEDHGEDIVDDSSVLNSSSDSPAGQVVPSEGPGGEHMVGSVPQPTGQVPSNTHISASISSMHVNVSTIAMWRWFMLLKLLSMTPKWLSLTGYLDVLPIMVYRTDWKIICYRLAQKSCKNLLFQQTGR